MFDQKEIQAYITNRDEADSFFFAMLVLMYFVLDVNLNYLFKICEIIYTLTLQKVFK